MPTYKIVNSEQLDADLGIVADAIREKGSTTNALSFPEGMKEAIEAITSGGGGGGSYKGEFSEGKTYNIGDIVTSYGNVYLVTGEPNPTAPSIEYFGWEQLNSGGDVFKGEYSYEREYCAGDVVTYGGDVYQFTSSFIYDHRPMEYMPWTKLNTNSGGDSSGGGGLVTLPAGTYAFMSSAPEYSDRNKLAYKFEITESISGSYSVQDQSGTFSTMTLIGKGGSYDASAKFDDVVLEYLLGNYGDYITIDSDTQVSSAFYDVFMSAFLKG